VVAVSSPCRHLSLPGENFSRSLSDYSRPSTSNFYIGPVAESAVNRRNLDFSVRSDCVATESRVCGNRSGR
jgi:hypothetical protein